MAVAGVLPGGEDEHGVRLDVAEAAGFSFLGGAVVGAGLAKGTEGGRVLARFGREVPAEAEHVRPGGEAAVRVERVQVEARLDEPGGVVGHVQEHECFPVADAAVEGACVLRGLGRVLGDVRGDGLFGDVGAVSEGRDGPYVELRAPAEGTGGLVGSGRNRDRGVRVGDGGPDGAVE